MANARAQERHRGVFRLAAAQSGKIVVVRDLEREPRQRGRAGQRKRQQPGLLELPDILVAPGTGGERPGCQRQAVAAGAAIGARRALAVGDDKPPAIAADGDCVRVPAGRDEPDDAAHRRRYIVIVTVRRARPGALGEDNDGERVESAERDVKRALVRRQGKPVRIGTLEMLAIR